MTLWQIDIGAVRPPRVPAGPPTLPATSGDSVPPVTREHDQLSDRESIRIAADAHEMGLADRLQVRACRGYLVEGDVDRQSLEVLASQLLVDALNEQLTLDEVASSVWQEAPWPGAQLVYVLPLPGVMDPVAQSTLELLRRHGLSIQAMRTYRRYWLGGLSPDECKTLASRLLYNASIEQAVFGPLQLDRLDSGKPYHFQLQHVPLRDMASDEQLLQLSREGQLSLSLPEMRTIRDHFVELQRDPTDVELETIAQTWSEHCSHKTLAGRIRYTDDQGTRQFQNMLKETIFAATQQIRQSLGTNDWCVSVFQDNAGIIDFDDEYCVTFKVETHNHPSALEPYGGANTGLGGVLRDTLGTGLGAKPVASTDVFCFAPPDVRAEDLPAGVLHPRRVLKGVVSGVRDYGNRMGIPTVNGAVYFDRRYLGNPLVYCGSVGMIPRHAVHKQAQQDDWIVTLGGKTGRDGIHGATFSSIELTSHSEVVSGGAVQIGNAITEKMLMDVQLAARDRKLFTAVTDCGAGGYSSAVGEMGAELGAEVWLEKIPLKYEGLSYTELWISEAQERMVLAVPPSTWPELQALAASEGVEATIIGRFTGTHRLVLQYAGQQVADLAMSFLHDGRPPVIREAIYQVPPPQPLLWKSRREGTLASVSGQRPMEQALLGLLGSWNIASKHWIIRQYDHEVQGGSVIKPLVGDDGPSDAAVVRPRLDSRRGLVIACGMNPAYGDLDPYHMAACAIDEAVRNCVAVGADPARIAILDNFCWGNTQRPETLGSLVRAALACYDLALAFGTPFISGKDSLNNEFSHVDHQGEKQTLTIPASLLISALGQVEDVARCVTMDAKEAGNELFLIGMTRPHFGGAHYTHYRGGSGGAVPQVYPTEAIATFRAVHRAMADGLVRACHDLSEGGLAVAAAEMALAGACGIELDLTAEVQAVVSDGSEFDLAELLLFSESPSRFLCEVPPMQVFAFQSLMRDLPYCRVGRVLDHGRFVILAEGDLGSATGADTSRLLVDLAVADLKHAWLAPLDLDRTDPSPP